MVGAEPVADVPACDTITVSAVTPKPLTEMEKIGMQAESAPNREYEIPPRWSE